MALRRIYGPKREEVREDERKLHNEELYNLYFSLNIRVAKLRIRWAGQVACTREIRNVYVILLDSLKGRYHPEDLHR
jgi:hypothetical protein